MSFFQKWLNVFETFLYSGIDDYYDSENEYDRNLDIDISVYIQEIYDYTKKPI
jgi:hypothetical protein